MVRQVKVGASRHRPCDRTCNLYQAPETPSPMEALEDERVIWTDAVESTVVIGIDKSNDPSRKIPLEEDERDGEEWGARYASELTLSESCCR
ncbi:UNVERIFIED_CONTAM: hypothetical protein K2H54_041664 [Gekko kuhli]